MRSPDFTRREMLALSSSLMLSACRKAKPVRSGKPNIVVYLPDALRADQLGCYGCSAATSPIMDKFCGESILFENCLTQAAWTKPSIGSLFTGFLPSVHQAVTSNIAVSSETKPRVQTLRETFPTLAGGLKDLGYHTAWFLSNPHVQKEFGFARGFDHYRYVGSETPRSQVLSAMLWLSKRAREPFFLFIHGIDPHGPYTPKKKDYRSLFGDTPSGHRSTLSTADQDLLDSFDASYLKNAPRTALDALSPKGRSYLKHLYDGEILGVDATFGVLLDYLRREELDRNTVVAFVSDHGEAFGEHDAFGHGNTLYQEELHVPLAIRMPGRTTGMRVPWSVSQFDLYPTLLTLAGGTPPPGIQARTLLSEQGDLVIDEDGTVFACLDHRNADTTQWDTAMNIGSRKAMSLGHGASYALFDTKSDPQERKNLAGEKTDETFRAMLDTLKAAPAEHRKMAETFGPPTWTSGSEQLREDLDALGYL